MSTLTPYWFTNFLIEAAELKGSGVSQLKICNQLASKYKTTGPALRKRWKRHEDKKKQNGSKKSKKNTNVLSDEEEAAIITVLRTTSKSNRAIQKQELISYVRKKYRDNDNSWRGDKWLKGFMRRNKELLKISNLKIATPGRVAPSTADACEEFINMMKDLEPTLKADNTVNVDEFQLKVTGWGAGRQRIEAVRSDGSTLSSKVQTGKRGSCVGSMIAFIAADGNLLYTALCLKPDALGKDGDTGYIDVDMTELNSHNTRGSPVPQMKIYSVSGMINNEIWVKIWSGFLNHLTSVTPGKQYYVFMDNLAQHAQLECIEAGLAVNVEVRFLPKNTTHFTQPLDQFVFATMKKEMNKESTSKMVWSDINSLNHILRDAVYGSMAKAFTSNNIMASFRVCGIFPFDEEKIRERYSENIGNRSEDPQPISVVEEKCKDMINSVFKKDVVKQVSGGKRARATIKLSQAYTSGDVVQLAEQQARKKEEESETKKRKLEERSRIKEQRETEMKLRKEAAAEKKKEVEKKKEDKEKVRMYNTCSCCQKRQNQRNKDKNLWKKCETCLVFALCPDHREDMWMHDDICTA